MAKFKKLLILPPLIIGLALAIWLVRGKTQPERSAIAETARPVRVLTIAPRTVTPVGLGYGTAQPARTWRAVAEVKARVIFTAERLDAGQFFAEGAELLRLDDVEIKLEVARLESEIASLEAQKAKLEATVTNDNALLRIERESLVLAAKDLKRTESLVERSAISQADVDRDRRQVLVQEAVVARLENSLRLAPSERLVLAAQLDSARARRGQALLDIERAVIRAPFACRIAAVNVVRTQAVALGSVMIEADGIQVVEVEAHLPISHVRPLINRLSDEDFRSALTDPAFWSRFGLRPTVHLRGSGIDVSWDARFVRLRDVIDPKTRTIGIVVAVDKPYRQATPGIRPPLVKGMFVEVELRGKPREGRIVIPRSALHEGRVYLIDGESRLVTRPVKVDFAVGDELCLSEGLVAGDRIVLTDLIPALEGMLLAPQ